MQWLAIESATLVASVAVGEGGKILSEVTSHTALTHSERLLPMIDQALQLAAFTIEQIEDVVVSSGPGSFTGLRIGLATAKGLAHPGGKKLFPVSTLEALAWQQSPGIIVPLLDARRGEVYTAVYERCATGLSILVPPIAIALSDLLQRKELGESPYFVGEGASIYQEMIRLSLPSAHFVSPAHNWPRASSLAMVALADGRLPISVEELRPGYLRRSSAEQKLGQK